MTVSIIDALHNLRPNAEWSMRGGRLLWADPNQTQPTEEEIQAKIAELEAAEPMRLLRIQRNQLLQQTDWRFRSDLTPSQEWIDYCQALRDLPANSEPQLDENGNLTNVNWPVPPGE
jgi:hypothetical protein